MSILKVWYLILFVLTLLGGTSQAQADDYTQPPAAITGNALDTLHADTLFGHASVSYQDIKAFTKWSDVLQRQAKIDSTDRVVAWQEFLDSIRDKSKDEQIAAVNDYVNALPYITDMDNYGVEDHWATVEDFLEHNGGDCEDYALAKYFSLIELGFTPDQMRLVILYDADKNADHAVLAMTHNDKIEILDNQYSSVRDAQTISNYKPIYAISQEQWWRYL